MSQLLLAAGMPRSGSTWLYNAMRLLLLRDIGANGLACAWVGDMALMPESTCRLIKLHEVSESLMRQASFVAYSYRDLRDAMASQFRKFGTEPSLNQADYLVQQHDAWMATAHHTVRYEDMIVAPAIALGRIAKAMGLSEFDTKDLAAELDALSYDSTGERSETYHRVNLLHRGHVTDGRAGSWPNGLPEALERQIAARHKVWFKANGYAID